MQKPNRQSHRRTNYDYASNGLWFITIVTANRRLLFGTNHNHELRLNALGRIAYEEWEKSASIRDEMFFREFIVMPNHIHGIVGINKTEHELCMRTHGRVSLPDLELQPDGGLQLDRELQQDQWGKSKRGENGWTGSIRKPRSVSSFVAGYKSAVTSRVNGMLLDRGKPVFTRKNRLWQLNYHDSIIRDYNHYLRVCDYVLGNAGHH